MRVIAAALRPRAGFQVSEELLEVRNMLATRLEQWEQRVLLKGERRGEAALLLRQLERRFGVLPGWARDRVLAADTVMIEEWGLRLFEAASLEDVLA